MKSNATEALNQRVDRVTTGTLVIGVDIAKEQHVAQAANFRGRILNRKPIRFDNSEGGFKCLLRIVRQLQAEHRMNDLVVGMESTGHYFFNLANWLLDQGIQVVLVSPATTKRNKENRDNTPSKSDPKDAEVIADVIGRGYYMLYERKERIFERLNYLAKLRDRADRDLTRAKNRIHRWLDIHFPEYHTVFKDIFSARSMATLHEFPAPEDLNGLSVDNLIDRWGKHMRRPAGQSGRERAHRLLQIARKSVGNQVLKEARRELEWLLQDYQHHERERLETEVEMKALLPEVPAAGILQSTGLTPLLVASILAFGGDLTKLEHGDQLLRMAGLNLAERRSGKYQGQIKMSRRGSSLLRKQLYLAVLHLLKNSDTFRARHQHNITTKGMKKIQSLRKLIRKLARILVAMARTKETFKAEMATPLAA